jgi:hypothetical protein
MIAYTLTKALDRTTSHYLVQILLSIINHYSVSRVAFSGAISITFIDLRLKTLSKLFYHQLNPMKMDASLIGEYLSKLMD